MARVEQRALACQATVLSFPRNLVPGTWEGVKEGLRCADVRRVVDVTIRDGTDVAYEIGPHVRRDFVTPGVLAGLAESEPTAILLRAAGDEARKRCEDYFATFLTSLEGAGGNVHLFIEMRDGELSLDQYGREVQVLAFDGSLSVDEMGAYVAIRMLGGKGGPGSTGLLRSLVTEFAGFDAVLAERLMQFSESDILGLPETLGTIIEEDPLRWRTMSWAEGTQSSAEAGRSRHPLHEWHLALHSGPFQEEARLASKRRYWRACVQALTPWLEERRALVLDVLKKPLDAVQAAHGGRMPRPGPRNTTIYVDRSETDYNSVVGLANHGALAVPGDQASQQALAVCRLAKDVRDDIAHLRAPQLQRILALVTSMDALVSV